MQETVQEKPVENQRSGEPNRNILRAMRTAANNPRMASAYAWRHARRSIMTGIDPDWVDWPSIIYAGINNRCNYFCEFCDIGLANLERKRVNSDFVHNLMTEEMVPFEVWTHVFLTT